MIRISRLTDYAMVILSILARDPEQIYQTSEIATKTGINRPTVAKILKQLTKDKLVSSSRGVTGGYKLALKAEQISVAEIIQSLEGPLAITVCNIDVEQCAIADKCTIQSPWMKINKIIYNALETYTLSDLIAANNGDKDVIFNRS